MTNEKYMNMIRNNPYVIDRIENPSEEMQLLAVQMIAHFQHDIVLQFLFFVHHIRNPPQIPCLGITSMV